MASLAHQIKIRRWDKIKKKENKQLLNSQGNPTVPEAENPMFTLFTKLPAELQQKIWTFASNEPRFIGPTHRTVKREMAHISAAEKKGQLTDPSGGGGLNYHNNPLSILWVCHDSREIAKTARSQPLLEDFGNPVYIDFAIDIILCHEYDEYPAFCKRLDETFLP